MDPWSSASWDAATAGLPAPLAVVDLEAFDANAADLVRRAAGRPIRLASKSVRCRALIERALARPGFAGVMAYAVPEALWLVAQGVSEDVFVAYPCVDRAQLARLRTEARAAAAVTVTIDSTEHVDLLAGIPGEHPIQVAVDVDASLRVGPRGRQAHLGVRRSPLREPAEVVAVVRAAQRAGLVVRGLMFYDAQIAGLPDRLHLRTVKALSDRDLRERRRAVVDAVRPHADLAFVNGGGTGSLETTGADCALTELAAGSGLYGPGLFDGYRSFRPRPAAAYAIEVVRRPAPDIVTCFSGGYHASGPGDAARLPSVLTPGLHLLGTEGAGEVQTPMKGPAAHGLRLGDRVWLRHAKAGELAERFETFHLVSGDRVAQTVPTHRGERRNFG